MLVGRIERDPLDQIKNVAAAIIATFFNDLFKFLIEFLDNLTFLSFSGMRGKMMIEQLPNTK